MTNYRATKIPLLCDENTVRSWASFMRMHMDEVVKSLRSERVRHEMWFFGRDSSLYVIGVMDVDDMGASHAVAKTSNREVDIEHRRFKAHWNRTGARRLQIDSDREPVFDECELLFEARS